MPKMVRMIVRLLIVI